MDAPDGTSRPHRGAEVELHCAKCGKVCECKFVACSGPQALGIVEKLISGSPNFRNFEAALLVR